MRIGSFQLTIPKISTSRLWLHGTIWIILLVLLIILDNNPYSTGLSFLINGSRLLLYSSLIYINLNYLIPRYLNANKLAIYFVGLLILALIANPLSTVVQYVLLSQYPQLQNHIQAQQGPLFLISMIFLIFSTSGNVVNFDRTKKVPGGYVLPSAANDSCKRDTSWPAFKRRLTARNESLMRVSRK